MSDPAPARAHLAFAPDWEVWAAVPDTMPRGEYASYEDWARAVVDVLTEDDWTANDRVRLTDALLTVARTREDDELRFVNLADPLRFVYYVSVLCWDSEESVPVESIVGEIPGGVRPTAIEPFESPYFAEGARGIVFQDTGGDNHDIGGSARWALRGGGLDVVCLLNLYNFVAFEAAVPVVDELVRSMSLSDGSSLAVASAAGERTAATTEAEVASPPRRKSFFDE